MNPPGSGQFTRHDQEYWQQVEALFAPDPNLRDQALDYLSRAGTFKGSALGFYLLATRISDPDLEVRFHVVQELGRLLDLNSSQEYVDEMVLVHVQGYFSQIRKEQLVHLLEVAERYLSAEEAVAHILRVCSLAGQGLSAIVNDPDLPGSIRQQAIYFCGQVGFLETEPALSTLLRRIERNRSRQHSFSADDAKGEEILYNFAVSALEKLRTVSSGEGDEHG